MPKIGGRIINIQDPNGVIAEAKQIEFENSNVFEEIKKIKETPEIDLSKYATKDELNSFKPQKIYTAYDDAENDLVNLDYGYVVSIFSGENLDEKYNADYDLYIVVKDSTNNKKLKKIQGGNAIVSGNIIFSVSEVIVDGITYTDFSNIEANIGSIITFKYSFESTNYSDVRGTVYVRRGSDVVVNEKVLPDGEPRSVSYNTTGISAGTYVFTLYGADSTGRQSERSKISILIGGLNISSTFDESRTLVFGEALNIPVNITSADTTSKLQANVSIDGTSVLVKDASIGNSVLEVKNIGVGTHRVKIWVVNTVSKKISNELDYNIVVAEEGKIYVLTNSDEYTSSEGSKQDVLVRVIQVGQEDGVFPAKFEIIAPSGEIVKTSNYTFEYGMNLISIINLKNINESDEETIYTGKLTVFLKDAPEIDPCEKTFTIKITKNNYNIPLKGTENLLCEFIASGKTNSSDNRDVWEDSSGNNIQTHFNNFNWESNGWINDDDGNTALTLNSGAYVEVDLTPFVNDIGSNESMTISIDFSTKDILDSNAKVISCLQETLGDENYIYYLRDNFGDYVKKGDSNIIKYFNSQGGYCWVDGITYSATGIMDYETTMAASERAINYNLGDSNPDYDGKTNFKKFTGSKRQEVVKQKGFYIDTQYAILSHSGSLANPTDKFYLNFSEDTRTKIDFIITRNEAQDAATNPYCFKCMVGYTNGILSLMKELNDNESFQQIDTSGNKFKVYLGCKATPNITGGVDISETGSSKIYSFRIYNRALTPDEILQNYVAEIPNFERKKELIDNNGILDASSLASLPKLWLMGYKSQTSQISSIQKFIMQLRNSDLPIADLKKIKEPAYITYMDESGDTWKIGKGETETDVIPVRLQFQGTSSMVYPVKNYKFKMYESFTEDSTGKIKYSKTKVKKDIGSGFPENCICLKADYMDSSHCNNTGTANFISDYNQISGPTPASYLDSRVRTTIYGYPILVYYKDTPESTIDHFIGVYNMNLDKSCVQSFGFKKEMPDRDPETYKQGLYEFKQIRYIDDDFNNDILVKSEVNSLSEFSDSASLTGRTTQICISNKCVQGEIIEDTNGIVVGIKYNDKIYKAKTDPLKKSYYLVLKNPNDNVDCALLDSIGRIRNINLDKTTSVQCFEFKANSGAAGAGGFGNYSVDSISTDLESRYPDDGDMEEDEYDPYVESVGKSNAIDYKHFRAPYYFNMQRMIKWLSNSNEEEFKKNIDRYFNRTYLMDYYLTILFIGGVDSLGKNLMVASWGPENLLFITDENALVYGSENYDKDAFKYIDNSDGTENILYLTPNKTKTPASDPAALGYPYEYLFAKNSLGQYLYYKEEAYNRFTNKFENGYSKWDSKVVTTKPGEDIQYPIFYDIDTINGLDNSGQLLFDVDIEIGDRLEDGTAVFNTDDSNLWRRVRDYFGGVGNELAERWKILREKYFTTENFINKFMYEKQIAKIPEAYYNKDCFLKYIYEGPNTPGTKFDNSDEIVPRGSGTYLYCIHGSRYEHIKRWYTQRLYYIDTMFGNMGGNNSSLRFNHHGYDANYRSDPNYYNNYELLPIKYPDVYRYDAETGSLYSKERDTSGKLVEYEVLPIKFKFKTYQPAYIGVKWSNTSKQLMYRLKRDETVEVIGNVPSAGDSEVFIYGDKNIKEIGDLSPFNVKKIDFSNLTKLSKLILGSTDHSSVINSIELGNNTYLADLQVNNCSSLSTLNLSKCINLRNLEMTGSKITSLTLPQGGALESIAYSDQITVIDLQNFTNLSYIKTEELKNLTKLIVKNCPKILGTLTTPNSMGWALLQKAAAADKDNTLYTVEMTAYGQVDPIISNNSEFFFADKFYNYNTSKSIKGEANYTGSEIPKFYSYYKNSYPKLKIHYTKITDGSNMFKDYNNISLIKTVEAYIGKDPYTGKDKTQKVFYWADETEELINKWHTQANYNKYGAENIYKNSNQFYIDGSGRYYRLLGIRDDSDLDSVRVEIKKNLESFSGTKFKKVCNMFENFAILDYLDEDTFNSIDLSEADTTEMFKNCSNLKYFKLPSDIVKNEILYRYYNKIGENEYEEVSFEEWDSSTGKSELKLNSSGDQLYRDPFRLTETTSPTSEYKKGIRNINSNMFYNCKKLRLLIPKLKTDGKYFISKNAFEYITFDPSLEYQSKEITSDRPVIMFEYSGTDLLKTTNVETSEPTETSGLFYYLDENKLKNLNSENIYINFEDYSAPWLREVYFNVKDLKIKDSTLDENFIISYAILNNNKIILTDVIQKNLETPFTKFNRDSETSSNIPLNNNLNIYSYTQGAFVNIADSVLEYQIPLPKYDCLDKRLNRQDYENSMLIYFTNDDFSSMDIKIIEEKMPKMEKLFICETERIPDRLFENFINLKQLSIDTGLYYIGTNAFSSCSSLQSIIFRRNTNETYFKKTEIKEIGDGAFRSTNLKNIYLPNSLTTLGANVFAECASLEFVSYSSGLTYIPENCFSRCVKLSSIVDMNYETLREIRGYAFNECKALVFPVSGTADASDWDFSLFKSLEVIADYAFQGTTKIAIGSPKTKDDNGNEIINPKLTIKKLILPDTLKRIGVSAFSQDVGNGFSLINVEIVWSGSDFSNLVIGQDAFENIRTSWTPDGYTEPLENTIYIPRIRGIGRTAFRSRTVETGFVLALSAQPETEIGSNWVSVVRKIVNNFVGIQAINNITYIFTENNNKNYSLVYHVDSDISQYDIAYSVMFNEKEYIVKELLSNCLEKIGDNLTGINFPVNSQLSKIETSVINSRNFMNIFFENGGSLEPSVNKIPDGLVIASGNIFKGTPWWEAQESGKFIILGKYIIGYKASNNAPLTKLDLGDIDSGLSECSIVYDNAFASLNEISKLTIGNNIVEIYKEAFKDCSNITEINIPESVLTIGASAFEGCQISSLFIPASLKNVNENSFGSNNGYGSIKKIIIEDGSLITVIPAQFPLELTTGESIPSKVNISLNEIHIPSSTNINFGNYRNILSQITGLTVGNLKKENNSYLVQNYPLWKNINDSLSIVKNDEFNTEVYDENNNRLYIPAFLVELANRLSLSVDTSLTTTEAKSICPIGDITNEDGEIITNGYDKDLDLLNITTYSKGVFDSAVPVEAQNNVRNLTRIDILRILAGYAGINNKNANRSTITLKDSDYKKLSVTDQSRIIPKLKIIIRRHLEK